MVASPISGWPSNLTEWMLCGTNILCCVLSAIYCSRHPSKFEKDVIKMVEEKNRKSNQNIK